jgi:hypothetical protein
MAKAAGGTNHRLKPSGATMRSLDKKPLLSSSVVMLSPFFEYVFANRKTLPYHML